MTDALIYLVGRGAVRAAGEARWGWARCSATWSPARPSGHRGCGFVERRRVDPAFLRVRRGADAVPHRPRTRPAPAVVDARASVRRRRPAAAGCAASRWPAAALLVAFGQDRRHAWRAWRWRSRPPPSPVQTMAERNLLADAHRAQRLRRAAVPGHRGDPADRR
ncbi:MAG: hypothetical protein MZW92_38430 [Comamonadaceae bacterium]|nr:hypothetical protein [Comamonadaceae bacterium]